MFPLKDRKITGYKFGQKTFYSDFHIGVDYGTEDMELRAPFDGIITFRGIGTQGGKTLWFKPKNDSVVMRFLHLDSYIVKQGESVVMGQLLGYTGNTGTSTAGHLHLDISKNSVNLNDLKNFIDPEKYDWEPLTKTFMKITVVANKNNWTTLPQKLEQLKQDFLLFSSNRLEPVFDIKHSDFDTVPLAPFNDVKSVDVNWYRENITPLGTGQATLLLLNPEQYQNGNVWGFMTWGDPNRPVRMEVMALENEGNVFVERAFHEICHSLYFLTGQPDRTHELLLQNPPKNLELLNEIDYVKLQAKLVTIKPMEKIKIRQVGWTDAEKGLYIPFDTEATQAEIVSKINEILPKYELDKTKEYNLGRRPF